MPPPLTPAQILDLPMRRNDAGAETLRGYFTELALQVWRKDENFSGKRPFGNSCWWNEVRAALADAGIVPRDADIDEYDETIQDAIRAMATAPAELLTLTPAPTKCGFCPSTSTRTITMTDPTAAVPDAEVRICGQHVMDGVRWLNDTVVSG